MAEQESFKLSYLQNLIFGEYLQEDENPLYIIQVHVVLIIISFIKYFLLLIPTLIIWYIWSDNEYVFLAALAISLISTSLIALRWYNWYADAFILTDKNILFIEWDSIVKIKSSRISYTEVESSSVELEGFLGTMMGFGELKIETANENFTPILKGARNASEAERQVLKNKEKYARQDGEIETGVFKKALREIMDEYFDKDTNVETEPEETATPEIRFAKYKIRGERFHMHDDMDKSKEDMQPDRYEGYRVKQDIATPEEMEAPKKVDKIKKRFDKYRETDADEKKKYD